MEEVKESWTTKEEANTRAQSACALGPTVPISFDKYNTLPIRMTSAMEIF
jgi:hypothetical protein